MMNKKRNLLAAWNLTLFVIVIAAWLELLLYEGDGTLTAVGLHSLRYYTVLSNLFEAVASLGTGVALLCGTEKSLRFWQTLKLAAASCVIVTFSVVMLFLGVIYGYPAMLSGANLWFHLLVPLAAALEYIFFDRFGKTAFRQTFFCLLPTFAYGVWYTVRVLFFAGDDFYRFVTWGVAPGCLIFLLIMVFQFGAACLLRRLNGRKKKT